MYTRTFVMSARATLMKEINHAITCFIVFAACNVCKKAVPNSWLTGHVYLAHLQKPLYDCAACGWFRRRMHHGHLPVKQHCLDWHGSTRFQRSNRVDSAKLNWLRELCFSPEADPEALKRIPTVPPEDRAPNHAKILYSTLMPLNFKYLLFLPDLTSKNFSHMPFQSVTIASGDLG